MEKEARAKLNLSLEILSKNWDGYHTIKSVFQEISYGDRIFVEVSNKDEIIFDAKGVPIVNSSVEKAVKVFRESTGFRSPVKIIVEKRVPVGGGLGGGSADAACVVSAMNELFGKPLSVQDLARCAEKVGKDVPFFLFGGTALVEGCGEIVRHIDQLDCFFLVVTPSFHFSTKKAYAMFDRYGTFSKGEKSDLLVGAISNGVDAERLNEYFCNDFEDLYRAVDTRFRDFLALLSSATKLKFYLTGSGSCVFRAFSDEGKAQSVKKILEGNNIESFVCNTFRIT